MKSGLRFLVALLVFTLGFETCQRALAQGRPSLAAIAAAKSATTGEHPKSKLELVTDGMKTAGETFVPLSSIQRASASIEATRPVRRCTIGWYIAKTRRFSTARRRDVSSE